MLLPEAISGIIAGFTVTLVTILNSSVIAAAIDAGGLGDTAYRYGYQRFDMQMMLAIIVIVMFVQACAKQFIGDHNLTYSGCHSKIVKLILILLIHCCRIRDIFKITRFSIGQILKTLTQSNHEIVPKKTHFLFNFAKIYFVGNLQ